MIETPRLVGIWSIGVSVGLGCLFALAFDSSALGYTEASRYVFCSEKNCRDGYASDGVAMDQSGNIYGVTDAGGRYDSGVVYEYSPGTGKYSVLYDFCRKLRKLRCRGRTPGRVKLVIDTAGNLYGTTEFGGNNKMDGGVIFELSPGTRRWHERLLHVFCQHGTCSDGACPLDGLTYAGAAAGQAYDGVSPLYGTTDVGGAFSEGTVFSIVPNSDGGKAAYTVLYSFCAQRNCTDGLDVDTPLYMDSAGNIYGTTEQGGQSDKGVVFELSSNGSSYSQSVLYSFCQQANCTDGAYPNGGVIMDLSGNLVGTAGGGTNADGLVFELSLNSGKWQYSVLDNFDGTNGRGPGSLMIDGSGNFFGATYTGGQKNDGTVFEFNGSIQSLYSFCLVKGCADGKLPEATLVEDASGNLYGTTLEEGEGYENGGTLYELSPSRK
jgi:uncharacterized repeat protein (TIGR03803 family)